jgi:hypothetical protein
MTNILKVPRIRRLFVWSLSVACLAVSPMMIGGAAQSDAKTTPDISGFWELNFDSRQVLPARRRLHRRRSRCCLRTRLLKRPALSENSCSR